MRSKIFSTFLSFSLIFTSAFARADFESDFAAAPAPTSERLEYFIQKAQQSYFTGEDQELARKFYEQVALLRSEAALTQDQIKVVHFSMHRLSQLSLNPTLRDNWIKASLDFAPELSPDADLFPPPVTQRFYELKKDFKLIAEKDSKLPAVLPPQPQEEVTLAPQPELPQATAPYSAQLEKPLENSAPFWKNKWVWIGAGVLVAGFVVYDQNKKDKQQSNSSVTYGF